MKDIPMTEMTQSPKRNARKTPPVPAAVADAPESTLQRGTAAPAARAAAPVPLSAMQDAAFARNWWRVVIDTERTPYASLLADVTVWGPNEPRLRAGDLVEVLDDQSTLFALLYLVEHVPAKVVRFAELIKAPLGGVAIGRVEARGNHHVQWRGPAKRWCIVGPTGTVVRDGILTKDEAERDAATRNTPASMAFISHPRM
jgi:hypothetical protein